MIRQGGKGVHVRKTPGRSINYVNMNVLPSLVGVPPLSSSWSYPPFSRPKQRAGETSKPEVVLDDYSTFKPHG